MGFPLHRLLLDATAAMSDSTVTAALSVAQASSASPAPAAEHAQVGRGLQRMLLLAAAFVVLVAWAAVAGVLYLKREDALEAETRQNTNIARAFEEQTVRVLATTDQATIRLRDAVVGAAPGDAVPDLVRFANETGLAPAILVQLSLVDATGHFVGSNLDPDGQRTGHVDLTAREHIQAHLNPSALPADIRPAQPDALFIGKPVLGKVSKKWTIQLSRRIAAADGRLLGVVVASLDPSYFEEVYRRVSLGRQGSLSLVGSDTVFRARVVGGQSTGMGSSVGRTGPFAVYSRQPEGTLRARSSVDGIERILAFRQVSKYPLHLVVTTAQEEALAGWSGLRNITVALTLLLTAAVAAGAALFVVSLRRLDQIMEALRRSEAQANAANQAKSEFLAAISHELRTPLTSIRGFAELMEQRLEQPKFRESASLIRKGAEHLNDLLTDILDMAKVEAGAMRLSSEPVEIRGLVQGTVDFFSLTAQAKGLSMQLEVADDVPHTIDGDSLRLKQVLNNLLSNAIKFTETGSITLKVERQGSDVAFHVIDTGPGIAPEMQEKVFEKFRQANDRISYQHGGTGLGLALARGLVELMRGRITLESAVGRGSRFTVTIPA